MIINLFKRRSERLSRRKSTLINKANKLAKLCDINVTLIICNRQISYYFTYNLINLEIWPPFK